MTRSLVTGATGYVGSRLVVALLGAGHDVVATARDPARLAGFDWVDDVDTAPLDVLDPGSCTAALDDGRPIDVVYYLVHAIGEGDFSERDRRGAENLGAAARAAGVGRIVYLGGFVPDGEELSDHLDSRAETAEVLERSGVPVVWLKAAVIVGAGSTSFEIIRYLADRLPVLPTPEWMSRLVQPIAIDDVLHYLVAAAGADLPAGAYDIAGDDVMPYRELLRRYLDAAGSRHRLLPVRGVAPGLAAAVIGRITPVPAALTADLIDSLRNTMISGETRIREFVPDPPGGLTTVEESMRRALAPPRPGARMTDGGDTLQLTATDPSWAGGDRLDVERSRAVAAPAATVWERVDGIGGRDGFYGWPLPWRVRGVGQRLASGRGLSHRRVSPDRLTVGDTVDFFTVEDVDPGRYVRFVTAPQAPGTGRLELWTTGDAGADRCTLHVRARWQPTGVSGRAWWYGLRPLHAGTFEAMLRTLARDAEAAVARSE